MKCHGVIVIVILALTLNAKCQSNLSTEILSRHRTSIKQAVVHSFTGTMEEMKAMTALPELYIGINGCSLRTDESVEVVKQIPLDRLLLETGKSPVTSATRATNARHRRTVV